MFLTNGWARLRQAQHYMQIVLSWLQMACEIIHVGRICLSATLLGLEA